MKFLKNLVLLVATVGLFSACSTDYQNLILGQWKVVKDHYYKVSEDNVMTQRVSDTELDYIFNFSEDGTVTHTSPSGETDTWEYTWKNGEIIMNGNNWEVEVLNNSTLQMFIFDATGGNTPTFYRCKRL